MIISTSIGLFGPYTAYEVMADRVRVWSSGSTPGRDPGADLPISVIGAYEVVDPKLPYDFDVATYAWVGGQLVPKEL